MVNRHEIGLTTQLSETVKLHTSRRLVSRSSMVMEVCLRKFYIAGR